MKKILLVLCLFVSSQLMAGTERFISIVDKSVPVAKFYQKLTNGSQDLVVTKSNIPGARKSIKINLQKGYKYLIVESFYNKKKIPGEIATLNGFRIIRESAKHKRHIHIGNMFIQEISIFDKEITLSRNDFSRSRKASRSNFLRNAYRNKSNLKASDFVTSVDFLKSRLSQLTGEEPVLIGSKKYVIKERGSEKYKKIARAFLKQEYEKLGYTVKLVPYKSSWHKGVNLIAERKGQDTSKYLQISSHLDSVNNAGADDDGSGTVANLALATKLKDMPLKYNLRIVAFDEEEKGLIGSKAYAKQIYLSGDIKRMIANISIDMIGYDSDNDGKMHAIHCNKAGSKDVADYFWGIAKGSKVKLSKSPACTNRSDHASFWKYEIPSILLSENFFGGDMNVCYHRKCDQIERIDYDFMSKITNTLTLHVASLLKL